MNYLDTPECFLNKYNQHHSDISIDEIVKLMLIDMENGLKGKPSSLMMIPTYLSTTGQLPLNKPVVVIDAGGTNLRLAAVQFSGNGLDVLKKARKEGIECPIILLTAKGEVSDKVAGLDELKFS